ncbi:MAG: class I SAM-dependent methyltransferase [Candidatus Falkowbacteria bacterium]|nr:class I SAM-dependent methyltransferase [Candidatus Falkowbacteria bacterium]
MRKDPEKREEKIFLSFVNPKGKDVLEIGCGSGRFSKIILRLGAKSLLALDQNVGKLEQAHHALAKKWPNARFQHGIGGNLWSFYSVDNDLFDLAVFSFSLHEHSDPVHGSEDAWARLKPDGEMIILEPRHEGELCQLLAPLVSEEEELARADKAIRDFVCTNKAQKEFFMNWHFKAPENLFKELLTCETEANQDFIERVAKDLAFQFPAAKPVIIKDKVICWWLKK